MKLFISILFICASMFAEIRDIDDAISKMGAQSYKIRKEAAQYLWQTYPVSYKALLRATEHSDPEIKENAKKVLERVSTGDLPINLETTAMAYMNKSVDDKTILTRLQKFANQGNPKAVMWLARLEMQGKCGLKQDPLQGYKKAVKVLPEIKKLADTGDSEAQFLLANAYMEKIGVERDLKKAAALYKESMNSKNIQAMHNLALMYLLGHGVSPDHEHAKELLKKAAESGSSLSKRVLRKEIFFFRKAKDVKRFNEIRSFPVFKVVGMDLDKGLNFLKEKKLLSTTTPDARNRENWHFYISSWLKFHKDGIRVIYNELNRRIVGIELFSGENDTLKQYKGKLPFDLKWNDTLATGKYKPGETGDNSHNEVYHAYQKKYHLGNINFSTMYSYKNNKNLYILQVYEMWAVNYEN